MPDDVKRTEDEISSIQFFHKHRGDITRYCDWEDVKAKYPEVETALRRLKHEKLCLDLIIENLSADSEGSRE